MNEPFYILRFTNVVDQPDIMVVSSSGIILCFMLLFCSPLGKTEKCRAVIQNELSSSFSFSFSSSTSRSLVICITSTRKSKTCSKRCLNSSVQSDPDDLVVHREQSMKLWRVALWGLCHSLECELMAQGSI